MANPSETKLRKLYEKHGGVITAIAAELGRPAATVRDWYRRLGLSGKGRGAPPSVRPTEESLRALHEQLGGNASAIAKAGGWSQASVSNWLADLGLPAMGRNWKPIYPTEIAETVTDGHVVIFSDAHWWDLERTPAHEALLETCKRLQPAMIIANGDVLDGARISRHDPIGWDDLPHLSDELHVCRRHLADLAKASEARLILALGNHDTRLEKYLIRYARELEGLDGTRLADHFLGWDICWSVRLNGGTVGDTVIKHRLRGGQHATWNNLLRAGTNIVTGHLHSQRVYPFTDYRGTRWGVDLGCLADPKAPSFLYTESNPLDWRSGFAVLTFEGGRLQPPQLATVTDDGGVILQRNERVL